MITVNLNLQPGRLAVFVLNDLQVNILPNMVYYHSGHSYLLYNRRAGTAMEKHLKSMRTIHQFDANCGIKTRNDNAENSYLW